MRRGTKLAAAVGAAAAFLTLPSASLAVDRARIAFAADESIQTMAADGSNRLRLTDGLPWIGRHADTNPTWTPDGKRIVYEHWLVTLDEYGFLNSSERGRVWVMDADGTSKRSLLPDPGRHAEDWLIAMRPDGRVLVERTDYSAPKDKRLSVIAVDPDGSDAKRLPNPRRYIANDVTFSPDGKRMLYTSYHADRNYFWHPSLWAARANGTHARRLAKDGGYGRWSPDGKRITFMSVRDRNGASCDSDYCDWLGEIYAMRSDGSRLRRLTFTKADDQHPEWSSDGTRIAFQSNRNFPQGSGSSEIYTVRPDGTCLTWLTNGSTSSETPAWQPGAGEAGAGGCGALGRKPLVDLDLSKSKIAGNFPIYWLGPVVNGRIIPSYISQGYKGSFALSYDDCGYFNPGPCGEPTAIDNDDECNRGIYGRLWDLLDHTKPQALHKHGDVVHTMHGIAYTGRTVVDVGRDGERFVRTLDHLSLLGQSDPVDLPATTFPNWFWKELERTDVTAKQRTRREGIRRRLRELGVDGRFRCG